MSWPQKLAVLLGILFLAPASPTYAQSENSAQSPSKPAFQPASEEEVEQLRREVAELKQIILRMAAGKAEVASGSAHLVPANAIPDSAQPNASAYIPEEVAAPAPEGVSAPSAANIAPQKKAVGDPPGVAGWT